MIAASVILAAHDAAGTIGSAVASALAQSLREIEVVVVDDASRDATAEAARAAAGGDPRLRLVTMGENSGPAGARNAGIAAARGRYVAILDADDAFAPTRLEALVGLAEHDGAEMACDDLLLVDGDSGASLGPMFGPSGLPPVLDAAAFALADLPDPRAPRRGSGFLKPLVRRDFLRRHGLVYPERMRFAEDYAFALACLLAGARWRTLGRPLYRYAVHGRSLTARHRAADLEALRDADTAALAGLPADADAGTRRALALHLASVRRRAAWARFVEDYKAGAIGAALRAAAADPDTLRHVAGRCLAHLRERGLPGRPGRDQGRDLPRDLPGDLP
ncbi:glycosyltransferase family 2 protein [Salinarimonas rosea]|uniref:glycosyltransferase family 2 protein n=1 Tax=Salinarimonas rosea TaxID=552063 RepID=UPI0004037D73|nr:glycosyltransferase family 2 protein [Salinarimonas rosea]